MRLLSLCLVSASLLAPGMALAAPFTPLTIFQHAAMPVQVLILGLLAATAAAIAVCIRKLLQGPRLAGSSAFLKGLRLGGPLAGLVGAAFGTLNMTIGLANVKTVPPVAVLAPGWAEIASLILLGLITGSVAVIAHWAVEARIDRAVLGE
ncbi:hypothetical protein [Asticcacaulis sp. AND118]|uniref:hypothetical protein n=1 Tax=Asticcacaulis sp. AND118 TaxID=2840468 RepID=UPI001CFF590F|nr:hypothetical protein [Asticcacaulis sp. AND118]UDF05131.1 hypothetical protein LH365_17225 [Asticcacaulis sp. AND118]